MLATDIRARTFQDIVGQDTIVKGISNYLKSNNLPDVIFFVGNSGAGKTTLAYLTAMTLNCHNPITDKNGNKNPCGTCPSCLDVKNEHFQRDIHVYNGGQLKADGIDEIEEKLGYSAMTDENLIFVLNESQMISSIKKFLAMIEKPRKNTYFILTSTDKDKFKNVGGSNNKDQETTALRSRGAFFTIKPISASAIKDYLFNLLEKLDPEGSVPNTFLEEGLQLIAENANGNIRMAINDLSQCIASETYTNEEVMNLLGYEDEKEHIAILYNMALGNKSVLSKLKEIEIPSFFNYSWKVLTDIGFREIENTPFKEQWKEKSAKAILDSNNFPRLLKIYEDTNKICLSYFNEKVFLNFVYKYYKDITNVPVVKKIKTVKEVP